MFDPDANQKRENTDLLGFARFGGLDRLDWLMILISVLLGTIAAFLVGPALALAFLFARSISQPVVELRDVATAPCDHGCAGAHDDAVQ